MYERGLVRWHRLTPNMGDTMALTKRIYSTEARTFRDNGKFAGTLTVTNGKLVGVGGTGGGFKIFCGGTGEGFPDIPIRGKGSGRTWRYAGRGGHVRTAVEQADSIRGKARSTARHLLQAYTEITQLSVELLDALSSLYSAPIGRAAEFLGRLSSLSKRQSSAALLPLHAELEASEP